jgi:hypothetical protein
LYIIQSIHIKNIIICIINIIIIIIIIQSINIKNIIICVINIIIFIIILNIHLKNIIICVIIIIWFLNIIICVINIIIFIIILLSTSDTETIGLGSCIGSKNPISLSLAAHPYPNILLFIL